MALGPERRSIRKDGRGRDRKAGRVLRSRRDLGIRSWLGGDRGLATGGVGMDSRSPTC